MKDLIDQRNFKEKCARSIVKSYNVRYVANEEPKQKEEDLNAKSQNQENTTGQDKVFEADERYAHVPSSQYGTTSVQDPVTKEQIEKILGERKENLFESMKESQ